MTNKKKRPTLYLVPKLHERAKEKADELGISLNAFFVIAIDDYLNRNKSNISQIEEMLAVEIENEDKKEIE